MGVIYCTILLAFAPFWSHLDCRPLLFLPILFLAQITQIGTPWLVFFAGLSWDSIAFWPIGLSCLFYLAGSFTWPLWQRWVVNPYMVWGVFSLWAIFVHAGPLAVISFSSGADFPLKVMSDILFTVCCFPLCAFLWPFGRNH